MFPDQEELQTGSVPVSGGPAQDCFEISSGLASGGNAGEGVELRWRRKRIWILFFRTELG